METNEEVVADVSTFADYIVDQVTNSADARTLDELAAQREVVQHLLGAVRTALAVIDQEMAKQLEGGARQIGDKVYARRKDYKERFLHSTIISFLRSAAVLKHTNKETGEIDYEMVAQDVANGLRELYLSDSTRAKVTALDRLGIPRDEVINREFVGYKLSVTELDDDRAT